MKKSMIALMLGIVSISMMGQERIGSYTMGFFPEDKFDVLATEPNKGKFDIYFDVEGKHKSDNVKLDVSSKELQQFKATLIQVRDKFLEWQRTAKENKVSDINKDFPFTFPKLTVAWYGTKWWFSFNHYLTPKFFVFKDGSCAMVVHKKVVSSSNEYIDQEFYWILQTEEEFNELINYLDENIVNNYFNSKESTQDLFK